MQRDLTVAAAALFTCTLIACSPEPSSQLIRGWLDELVAAGAAEPWKAAQQINEHLLAEGESAGERAERLAEGMPVLAEFINNTAVDPMVRLEIVNLLGNWGSDAIPALPAMAKAMLDESIPEELRAEAIPGFASVARSAENPDASVVEILLQAESPVLFDAMAGSVEVMGRAAGDVVCSMIPDVAHQRLARLVESLGRLAEPLCVDKLAKLLGHPDLLVRRQAGYALGQIGEDAAMAVPSLVAAVIVPDCPDTKAICDTAREFAVRALGKIGREPQTVVPVLMEELSNGDLLQRITAARALGGFGSAANGARSKIEELLAEVESELDGSIRTFEMQGLRQVLERIGPGT